MFPQLFTMHITSSDANFREYHGIISKPVLIQYQVYNQTNVIIIYKYQT